MKSYHLDNFNTRRLGSITIKVLYEYCIRFQVLLSFIVINAHGGVKLANVVSCLFMTSASYRLTSVHIDDCNDVMREVNIVTSSNYPLFVQSTWSYRDWVKHICVNNLGDHLLE